MGGEAGLGKTPRCSRFTAKNSIILGRFLIFSDLHTQYRLLEMLFECKSKIQLSNISSNAIFLRKNLATFLGMLC